MIPINKVQDLIARHDNLEKELSSGSIDAKLFAKKSKEYSNLSDSIPSVLKITSSYDFQFIPLNMKINYIYNSDKIQELGISLIGEIDDKFYLYTGKYFYLDNMDLYSELDNIAFGLGILINNKYKIDFGVQHLNTNIFNIGTSLTVITLDNI